jgi:hypothetical protein
MKSAALGRNQRVGQRFTTSGDLAGAHRDSPSPTLKQGRPAPARIRGSPRSGGTIHGGKTAVTAVTGVTACHPSI